MIAVILPSRGLIFSQTADEILQNLKDIPHRIYFSHRKPLPDCFEEPTNRALKDKGITHLWFVEDDMVLPPDTLKKMLDKNLAVVTVNYPTTKDGRCAVLTIKGKVVYGGTGCTLVKREVFDELKPPYFRDDIAWIPKNKGDYIKLTGLQKGKDNDTYGLHDVNFFINLWRKNIPVHVMGFTIGQRKLKSLGKAGTNKGAHNIEVWTNITQRDYFEETKDWAEPDLSKLIEVNTPTGNVLVSPKHAKTLLDTGKAKKLPKQAVVIDDSGVI